LQGAFKDRIVSAALALACIGAVASRPADARTARQMRQEVEASMPVSATSTSIAADDAQRTAH